MVLSNGGRLKVEEGCLVALVGINVADIAIDLNDCLGLLLFPTLVPITALSHCRTPLITRHWLGILVSVNGGVEVAKTGELVSSQWSVSLRELETGLLIGLIHRHEFLRWENRHIHRRLYGHWTNHIEVHVLDCQFNVENKG